jgi:hypothetical protein
MKLRFVVGFDWRGELLSKPPGIGDLAMEHPKPEMLSPCSLIASGETS